MRQRAVSSIPSKFETVLHEGGRERDGFWNRTHRFNYTDNELPGPGTYTAPQSAEPTSTSYSKKGYGGMISKAPRLPKQRRATAPPPGSYNPDRCFRYLNDKKDVSKGATSGFAKPIVPDSVKQLRRKGPDGPGPGQYDPGAWQAAKAASKNMKSAPFMTGSERWAVKYTIVKKGQDAEGMGDEKVEEPVDLDLSKTGAFAEILSKKIPSAAFSSRTGRKFEREKGSSTVVDLLKPHPSLGPSLGIQVDIKPAVVRPPEEVPGPGSYEPHLSEQLLTLEKLRHSSMFSRTTLDRFGRPLQPKAQHIVVPGPGAYNTVEQEPLRTEASMSSFVSATERQAVAARRGVAPGPAYYNPSLAGKRSFHLNVSRRWL